jgi:C_GCAxxG_C_C family probable redox protein
MTVNRAERATELFKNGWTCSQSIMAVYGEDVGLDCETALNLGRGFSGGISRLGRTCGVISGAVMILSFKGRDAPDEARDRAEVYTAVNEFAKRFEERCGGFDCKDLLGVDISTTEGYAEAREKKLFPTKCPQFVGAAAEILEELL